MVSKDKLEKILSFILKLPCLKPKTKKDTSEIDEIMRKLELMDEKIDNSKAELDEKIKNMRKLTNVRLINLEANQKDITEKHRDVKKLIKSNLEGITNNTSLISENKKNINTHRLRRNSDSSDSSSSSDSDSSSDKD